MSPVADSFLLILVQSTSTQILISFFPVSAERTPLFFDSRIQSCETDAFHCINWLLLKKISITYCRLCRSSNTGNDRTFVLLINDESFVTYPSGAILQPLELSMAIGGKSGSLY